MFQPSRAISLAILFVLVSLSHASANASDSLTFTNGDQLTGKLMSVLSGTVSFHSDMLGDVTVPTSKISALHANEQFAVVEKKQQARRNVRVDEVPTGNVALDHNTVRLSSANSAEKSFPAEDDNSVIEATRLQRELRGESDLRYGWTGSLSLGASLISATNSAQTYSGAVAVARTIPTTAWLPPSSKITLNLSSTYGLSKDSDIVSRGNVFQTASSSKTDIKHGDAEYDKYLSPVRFALVAAIADHNFGNGLELQQAYGAGLGWSLIKNPRNSLEVKAGAGYEQQQFYNGLTSGLGTPTVNLIGALLTETWVRTFPHNTKLNQYVTVSPTFNVLRAYSAVASARLVFPFYKRLNFSVSSTDNYLGDPASGFRHNSFQFASGVSYVLK